MSPPVCSPYDDVLAAVCRAVVDREGGAISLEILAGQLFRDSIVGGTWRTARACVCDVISDLVAEGLLIKADDTGLDYIDAPYTAFKPANLLAYLAMSEAAEQFDIRAAQATQPLAGPPQNPPGEAREQPRAEVRQQPEPDSD